jgi:hypothetical protein
MKLRFFLLLICSLISVTAAFSQAQESRYFLQLQSGEIVYADKIQLKSPIFKTNHFLVNDTLKYNPSIVAAYQNEDGYFARIEVGNSYDSFAKRILDGPRVDKFYTSRTTYDYGSGYSSYAYNLPRTNRSRIYFFSKDNGPLYLLDFDNLQQALSDNAASMDILGKYRRNKLINTGVTVLGAGLMAAGAIGSINNSNDPNANIQISPLMYTGAGILGAQFVINLFQKDKLTQAMEVYNYQIKQ